MRRVPLNIEQCDIAAAALAKYHGYSSSGSCPIAQRLERCGVLAAVGVCSVGFGGYKLCLDRDARELVAAFDMGWPLKPCTVHILVPEAT